MTRERIKRLQNLTDQRKFNRLIDTVEDNELHWGGPAGGNNFVVCVCAYMVYNARLVWNLVYEVQLIKERNSLYLYTISRFIKNYKL